MTTDSKEMDYLDRQTLEKILDHSSDEIFVLDKNQRILYVNKTCERHYGLKPSDVIGKNNKDFLAKGYWRPSVVDEVFRTKAPVTKHQTTNTGNELITTAIPVFGASHDIEFIVSTARQFHRQEAIKIEKQEDTQKAGEPRVQSGMISLSPQMQAVLDIAQRAAKVNSTVLIHGESGTGKGLLANYIHRASPRHKETFLTINCAAIPEELLESELFGYAPGAFTGASSRGKVGLIESANHGTIFLDEIGEISLKTQVKLLQLVQEHSFIPVGGHKLKKVDVRVIAATNQNLPALVEQGQFREDLFYRLNVIELTLPALRERADDIVPLIQFFLHKFNQKYDRHLTISKDSMEVMRGYTWPGNIRQLQNVIERSVIMSDAVIRKKDLPDELLDEANLSEFDEEDENTVVPSVTRPEFAPNGVALDDALEDLERQLVTSAYAQHPSSRKLANALQISQSRASRLIRKYGL